MPLKILVVEDDPLILEFMSEIIAGFDADVRPVGDSEAAATLVERERFDGIFLDLQMPKLNGFQVLEWLRNRPDLSTMAVAIMTSSDYDPDMTRAYELGASSYLVKPPNAEALLALVQRLHAYWLILDEKSVSMAA